MAASRKTRSTGPTYEHYVFEVEAPALTYSLSINEPPLFEGLYWEHPSIRFSGRTIAPERLLDRRISVQLVGGKLRNEPPAHDPSWRPSCVGMLELGKTRGDFYVRLPMHALWGLSAAIAGRELRCMLLYGPTLRRGKSLIRELRFEREFDPEMIE